MDGEAISLVARGTDRKRYIFDNVTGHRPYFYTKDYLNVPNDPRVTGVEHAWASYDHKFVTNRIYTKHSIDVANKQTREGVRYYFDALDCYEDDVFYITRWLIDTGLFGGFKTEKQGMLTIADLEPYQCIVPLRNQHLDIETLTSPQLDLHDPASILSAPVPVTALSAVDSYNPSICTTFQWHPALRDDVIYDKVIKLPGSDHTYKWDLRFYTDEYKMLTQWVKYTAECALDGITAWNAFKFDIPYTFGRCRRLGVDCSLLSPFHNLYFDNFRHSVHIDGLNLFDTMQLYSRFQTGGAGLGLNDTAIRVLNYGKIQHKKSLNWLFLHNPIFLGYYNAADAILDYEIAMKEKLFVMLQEYKNLVGCVYDDLFSNKRMVDVFFLREARADQIVLPSKRDNPYNKYEGAFVPVPHLGRSSAIITVDFKSLYPAIMVSFNMGNDTLDAAGAIKTPSNGPRFSNEHPSFIARVLKKLLSYRAQVQADWKKETDEYEKERLDRVQTVVKFLINSIYGVLGHTDFRLYERRIAEAITGTARWCIKDTIRVCERLGYRVLYGDTDSVFLFSKKSFDVDGYDAVIQDAKDLEKILNTYYQQYTKLFNLYENMFNTKIEKVWYNIRFIKKKGTEQAAKKRYFGLLAWFKEKEFREQGKFESVGLKRTDTSTVGANILTNVLENDANGMSNSELNDYINGECRNIKSMTYSLRDIALQMGMQKPVEEYHNIPLKRAVQFTLNNCAKWDGRFSGTIGMKVRMLPMIKRLIPSKYNEPSDIIALDDEDSLPDDLLACIDFDMLIKKSIFMKLENIIDGLNTNEVALI
jgi:DNA polymerase I